MLECRCIFNLSGDVEAYRCEGMRKICESLIENYFDGQVRNKADLVRILDDYSVGDEVILKILRDGESLEVPLKLEETTS